MKTIKKWEKSGLDWDEYFQVGDQINEEVFLDIAETVSPEYSSEGYVQGGEPQFTKRLFGGEKIYYHVTALKTVEGKYYYLGCLPSFTQLKVS